jgi:hypothetical protein
MKEARDTVRNLGEKSLGKRQPRSREKGTFREILDWDVQGNGSYRCRWILY